MRHRFKTKAWLYLTPALLIIFIVIVFPILYTGYISVTNMSLYHWSDYKVIGLDNYARALFKFDSVFLSALLTTVLWTALNMVIQCKRAQFSQKTRFLCQRCDGCNKMHK